MKKIFLLFLLITAIQSVSAQIDSIFYFKGIRQPDSSIKTEAGLIIKRDNSQKTGFKITYPKGGSKADEKIDEILANTDKQISETEQLIAQIKIPELREQLRFLLETEKLDKETFEKLKNSFDKDEKWDEEEKKKNDPEPCKRSEIDYKEMRDYVNMVLQENQITATAPPVLDYNCLSMHPEILRSYYFAQDEYVNNFFSNEDEMMKKTMINIKYSEMFSCQYDNSNFEKLIEKIIRIYIKKTEYFKKNFIEALPSGPQRMENALLYFRISFIVAKNGSTIGQGETVNSFIQDASEYFNKITDNEISKYEKLLATGDLKAFTYLSIYKNLKYEKARFGDYNDELANDISFVAQSLFKLSMSFEGKLKETENSDYLNQSASVKAKDFYFLCVPDSADGVKFLPVSIMEKQFHVYDVFPSEKIAFENPAGLMTTKDGSMRFTSPMDYSCPAPELTVKNICDNPDSCILRLEYLGPQLTNFQETWEANPGGSIKLPEGLNNIFKNLFMYSEMMKTANELKENPNSMQVDEEKLKEKAKKMADELKEKMKDPNFNYQDYLKKMQETIMNEMKPQTDMINSLKGFKFALSYGNASKEPVNVILQAGVINPDFAKYIESGTATIKLRKINPVVKQKNLFELANE